MLTTDGQIQIVRADGQTLDLHQGTPYLVSQFNPFSRSVRADQGGPVPWGDGDWSGAEWREGSTVPLSVEIDAADWATVMQLYWAFDAALAPVRTEGDVELHWMAGGVEYLMYGRPRGVAMRSHSFEHGTAVVVAEIACPDPAIYSALEHSVTVGLLHRIGGVSVPFGTPVAINSVVADGEATVTNAGTSPARFLWRITGPVTRPRITVITDDIPQTLYLDTVLGGDDWLDIDTSAKSVVLNGSTSRLHDQYGDWPLLRGEALIRFEAEAYNSTAHLTSRHRDTY